MKNMLKTRLGSKSRKLSKLILVHGKNPMVSTLESPCSREFLEFSQFAMFLLFLEFVVCRVRHEVFTLREVFTFYVKTYRPHWRSV